MKQTMRASKTLLGGLVLFAALALVVQDAAAQPILESATCFGGTGGEWGTGIAIAEDEIYLSGYGPAYNLDGLLARYSLPPMASPEWAAYWPNQAGPGGSRDQFDGVAVSSEGLYAAGYGSTLASDGVGGFEHKSCLVKFPLSGATGGGPGGCTWYSSPNFFSYRGFEEFREAVTVEEDSGEVVYAAGWGEEYGWGGDRTTLAKYTPDGTLLWKRCYATDPSGNVVAGTHTRFGSSITLGLAHMNGFLYLAGYDRRADPAGGPPGQGMLLKYDAASQAPDPDPNATGAAVMTPVWEQVTGFNSTFKDVAAADGYIYVAGWLADGPYGGLDVLVAKYDEDGNLQWSNEWGGPAQEIAYGIAVNGDRLYVVGETSSFDAEGKDAFLLEVDAADGTILSTTFWGGPADDTGQDVAVAGPDIYVVGETASFGAGGYDLVLLRYTTILEVVIDIKPGSEPNSINLGAQGVVPVAILTTPDFDAMLVDEFSLTLSGSEVRLKGRSGHAGSMEDVDGDGYLDLVVQFYIDQLDLEEGSTEAVLEGFTLDGIPIIGFDWINVVP